MLWGEAEDDLCKTEFSKDEKHQQPQFFRYWYVQEVKNGHYFLEQLKRLPTNRHPQVVLIDLKMLLKNLFISPLTVRKHVAHIYEKLHVNSRAQVINIAHKKNWL